jgi:hypothetical protein
MKAFFANPIVHAVVVALVFVVTYVVTAGGAWQSVTLGSIAAGALHYLTTLE